MHQVRLNGQLYEEAERRDREAGVINVDDFVAETLERELAAEQEDYDSRFTPELISRLDQISNDMIAGKRDTIEEIDEHSAKVKKAFIRKSNGLPHPTIRHC